MPSSLGAGLGGITVYYLGLAFGTPTSSIIGSSSAGASLKFLIPVPPMLSYCFRKRSSVLSCSTRTGLEIGAFCSSGATSTFDAMPDSPLLVPDRPDLIRCNELRSTLSLGAYVLCSYPSFC